MKRVYESPVMMVEGFEANEYVATCWDVICKGSAWEVGHSEHGYVETYKSDSEPNWGNNDGDPFGTEYHWQGLTPRSVHVYTDSKGGKHWVAEC